MARIPAAERRNDFVQAALRIIALHGVDGATTRRIAEEANAPLASLHYCFSTKELLFAAVYDEVTSSYLNVVTEENSRHTSVVDAACDLLRRTAMWYLQDNDFAVAVLELVLWARREHDDPAIRLYDTTVAAVVRILRDASGTVPVGEDWLEQVAYLMSTLSDGFAINLLTYGDRAAALAQVDTVVAALAAWVSATQPTRPPSTAAPQTPNIASLASWAPRASV